ncbi:hypothetical protein SY2F82_29360 [Streptomyces sp. Y2F8-2]|nr:hypothetical protein SY2F82_29360 [Streptomyces sp. Y2F8-2]
MVVVMVDGFDRRVGHADILGVHREAVLGGGVDVDTQRVRLPGIETVRHTFGQSVDVSTAAGHAR